jgi:hypothetical protein
MCSGRAALLGSQRYSWQRRGKFQLIDESQLIVGFQLIVEFQFAVGFHQHLLSFDRLLL